MTSPFARRESRVVVAVPVKDEAELLEPCLIALTRQATSALDEILVFVNNSSDRSAALARQFAARSPIPVLVEDVVLPPEESHAGGARRRAMQWAASRVGEHGILLTTDADGVVAPDWAEVNLAAMASGAEAVAGRVVLDPGDEARLPPALRDADASECHYAALLDEIDARLDPDPGDPLPRHDEHSGASIAVTMAAYLRAGGMPRVASGEDREFFARLRRVDARIRHVHEAVVTVSGRIEGRAVGGMADTIRRRMVAIDAFLDGRLEPAHAAISRIAFRARLRWLFSGQAETREIRRLAADLNVTAGLVRRCLASRYFGTAWMMLEARCPDLRHRPVPATAVDEQIALARNFLATLNTNVMEKERLA
jgi:glycosyltransferase involved in cell wall biosynthesis